MSTNLIAQTAVAPSAGDGTSGNPYEIAIWQNLYWISENSSRWSSHYIQTSYIDFDTTTPAITFWDGGAGWTPIGNDATQFTGSYDGQGHVIGGIYISRSGVSNQGLFGRTNSDAEIQNLSVAEVDITGNTNVGGLIGFNYNTTISNCSCSGDVTGNTAVGGLVGNNRTGSITGCISNSNVTGNTNYTGGLVGLNEWSSTLSNSYSTGTVNGVTFVGGFAGGNTSTISNCYSIGSVSGTTDIGGLVGVNNSTVSNSFWNTETSGQVSSAGGTGKNNTDMKTQSTFTNAGWDFPTIWVMSTAAVNDGYPTLYWVPGNAIEPSQSGGTYQIASVNNLWWIAESSARWSYDYKQTVDIDATSTSRWDGGAGWIPIGNDATQFTGSYNGLEHTIDGLYISRSGANNQGLFGRTNSAAEIQNLNVTAVNIAGNLNVGGLVGFSMSSIINNCSCSGNVTGNTSVGGLLGNNRSGSITGCISNSNVTGNTNYTGGLVGLNEWSSTLSNSYSTGTVNGVTNIGGLAGGNASSTISNCYSIGDVSGTTAVGGLVGFNNLTVSNSFWDTETSGQSTSSGGTGKNNTEMKTQSTFTDAGWDFPDTWVMSTTAVNDGYPTLYWVPGNAIEPSQSGGIYQIASLNNLWWIAENSARWSYDYEQTADIYATSTSSLDGGAGWTPIGNETIKFTGTYNGQGHIINGIYINRPSVDYQGLFGYTDGSTIQNLAVIDVEITGQDEVGGLVGYNDNSSEVNNCFSSGNVTGTHWYDTGGLVGWNNNNSIVSNSYSTCNVTGIDYVGGLVAFISGNSTVSNSYSTGIVNGDDYIGGLVGENSVMSGGYINNCYSIGAVSGNENVGGLVGSNGYIVTNSFWDMETSGQSTSAGGTGKTTAEMKTQSTFTDAGWDFSTIWVMSTMVVNNGYPTLYWVAGNTIEPSQSGGKYQIASLNNLLWIAENSARWNYDYEQIADIYAASTSSLDGGAGWTPIGNESTKFTGTYNGQGHAINGIYINRASVDYQGFFGYTDGSTIQNLTVTDVEITGQDEVGGLVGANHNSSEVNNCSSSGNVTGIHWCDIGGLVGWNYNNSTVNNSYTTCNVTGKDYVGGIVALNSRNSTVSNSYSTGTVNGDNYIGGLVGENSSYLGSGYINNCYSIGAVSGNGNVGGLVGLNNSTVTNSFWDTETSGQSASAGGTGKTTVEMKTSSTFTSAGWDFMDTWTQVSSIISSASSYPLLQWEQTANVLAETPDQVSSVYQISSLENLRWIVEDDSRWDYDYEQTDDIDVSATSTWLSGAGWTPIGNETTKFTGSYDGQEHTINGLYISRSASYQGLFGYTNGSTIQNLGLISVDINNSGGNYTGGLVAMNYNSSQITSCYSTGSVSDLTGWDTGGLVGANHTNSTVANSYSTCSVSGDGNTGGLIGWHYGGSDVNNSYSTGNVISITDFNHVHTGGLIGLVQSATANTSYCSGDVTGKDNVGAFIGTINASTVNNCYSLGDITRSSGINTLFGGFAGYVESSPTIQYCYSTGSVFQSEGVAWADGTKGFIGGEEGTKCFACGADRKNGFVGREERSNSYTANFFDSEASNQSSATGATGKITAEMKTNTTFLDAGWSSLNWNIDPGFNSGYPYLAWQNTGGTSLSVELSIFSAQFIGNTPTIYWTTQSETDNMGWFVYRNKINDFTTSEKISELIEGHGTTTQLQSYVYEDKIKDPEVIDTCYYWLESIDYGGVLHHYDRVAILSGPDNDDPTQNGIPVPIRYGLFQNEPNPVISSTRIAFNLKETAQISLKVYNIKGQLVKTLYSGVTCKHTIMWDGKDDNERELENGVYFFNLSVNGKREETKKLILMK